MTTAYMLIVGNYPLLQISSCEVFDTGLDCDESLFDYFGFSYIAIMVLVVALCVTAALRVDKRTSNAVSAALAILWLIGVGGTLSGGAPNVVNILGFILPTVALAFVLSIMRSLQSE
ncbi:hypothetical protein [Rhodococcoides kroppenstedtii]|uniref:hypothetical protein n=1 Tax=Rhodococcoides kroppenstedtii TaxID=293050 RepID=UPI001C9AD96E|nr:hypothetical protein [Rhodococcus kroppenstedtii]MBY6314878.1 hypothetical protein [Rhodococcus kroppenstedtii]MBY6401358.1 hypothetical protein [Rhodococcus kroppenstedtii]